MTSLNRNEQWRAETLREVEREFPMLSPEAQEEVVEELERVENEMKTSLEIAHGFQKKKSHKSDDF
jgi:hypothetical protein